MIWFFRIGAALSPLVAGLLIACSPTPAVFAPPSRTAPIALANSTRPLCPTATSSPTLDLTTPPPAPETPTGPIPPPPAAYDSSKPGTPVSTRALAPGEKPPATPNPRITYAPVATLARPTVVTPVAARLTYRDPDFGFSFEYPANWWIDAPNLSCQPVPLKGTDVQIRNFTPFLKGSGNLEIFKVEITVMGDFGQYGTIDNWLAKVSKQDPTFSNSQIEHLIVSNLPAIRLTWEDGTDSVAFGKGQWLYQITAFWATSRYRATFEQILGSFHVP